MTPTGTTWAAVWNLLAFHSGLSLTGFIEDTTNEYRYSTEAKHKYVYKMIKLLNICEQLLV